MKRAANTFGSTCVTNSRQISSDRQPTPNKRLIDDNESP